MSIIIASSHVISDTVSGGGTINGNNPLIGYENLATTTNISSTTEADGFPVTNLVNPSTNLRWQGETSSPEEDEYITVAVAATDPMDYIAVAKHNFGSAQIAVSVEYLDTDASPDSWEELVSPVMLPNDGPALFRFSPQALSAIRLRLQPGSEAPRAAVLYTGKLLILQRRIYVGHTPIPYGRSTKVTNARSESGHFLGRIVLNQATGTSVELRNLTPDWYRTYMEPFVQNSYENPFFFAWRPQSYPREVGFAWMTNDPQPQNAVQNGMVQVALQMTGVT